MYPVSFYPERNVAMIQNSRGVSRFSGTLEKIGRNPNPVFNRQGVIRR